MACLATPGPARAQAEGYALSLRDVPVGTALEELVTLTGISLVYSSEVVRGRRTVCRTESASPEELLRCITEGAGLDFYRLSSGTYVVIEAPEALPAFGTLSGQIVDAVTGEPVPFAQVELADGTRSARSNGAGIFLLTRLLPGPHQLLVAQWGYTPQRLPLEKIGAEESDPAHARAINLNRWSACLAEMSIAVETLVACFPHTWIAGFSFGGTLALNLLREHPLRGGVLIAPALYPRRSLRYVGFRVLRRLMPALARRRYPRETTVVELMEQSRTNLARIETPLLVVQAARDPIVSRRGFDHLRRALPGETYRFLLLDSDRHVIVRGEDGSEVARLVGECIKRA